MDPALLQVGLPGTQELFIVLLIFVLLAGVFLVPIAIVAYLLLTRRGDDATDERVAELEAEVERLEADRESAGGSDSESE